MRGAAPDGPVAVFERGVRLAVVQRGDSDSTGAMTGNLLGRAAIPPRWLAVLELRDEIAGLSEELHAVFVTPDHLDHAERARRYPSA